MHDEVKRFIVAPKRDKLDRLPDDWEGRVTGTPGVTLVGSAFGRMQVDATDAAMEQVAKMLGDLLHIEPAQPRTFP
jgi:hypothetical protein